MTLNKETMSNILLECDVHFTAYSDVQVKEYMNIQGRQYTANKLILPNHQTKILTKKNKYTSEEVIICSVQADTLDNNRKVKLLRVPTGTLLRIGGTLKVRDFKVWVEQFAFSKAELTESQTEWLKKLFQVSNLKGYGFLSVPVKQFHGSNVWKIN